MIQLVEDDLEDALHTQLKDMLTAFLRKMRIDAPNFDAQNEFNAFLDESVRFCNSNSAEAKAVKASILEGMRCSTEKDRYPHLTYALNSILKHGRGKTIGSFQHSLDKDESLMVVNDPAIVQCGDTVLSASECTHDCYLKRNPALLRMPIQALGRLVGRNEPFDVLLTRLATSKSRLEEKNANWTDIIDCWEIRKGTDLIPEHSFKRLTDEEYKFTVECADERPFDKASVPIPATTNTSSTRPSAPPPSSTGTSSPSQTSVNLSSGILKRPRAAEDSQSDNAHTAHKRPKTEPESDPEPNPLHLRLSPETQVGVYALELMRTRWNRTHAIVILLEGNKLSLHWYDPQGCIRTHPIDIVSQLPLLVAMMLIFQRFDDRMRGNGKFQLNIEVDGETVPHSLDDSEIHNRWMFKGRRSVSGKLFPHGKIPPPKSESRSSRTTRSNANPTANDVPSNEEGELFGKFLWREEARHTEGVIIETALKRAERHLGEHKKHVIDHLPCVKTCTEFSDFSTKHIRNFLNLPSQGARVPTGIAAEWLLPSAELTDPEEYVRAIWQLIRCNFLLWQLGIAHGDISMTNLMLRPGSGSVQAVLNDFDLAAIMTPGNTSPERKGFERTGTIPFMAVELLGAADGDVGRIWCHDFESFLWCMVWYCSPKVQSAWKTGTCSEIGQKKTFWLALEPYTSRSTDTTVAEAAKPVWTSLRKLFRGWDYSFFTFGQENTGWEEQLAFLHRLVEHMSEYDSCEDRSWLEFRGKPSMQCVCSPPSSVVPCSTCT
ncbi:other/FunK1 protein kinase [Coprinopsis cinerea okayama7|uniref:Other/FunK1 protein kinase n=1 Tax=Coprinopsis cinerea (strain Okayama-7 / 130 / ATCC MYA-4618 / FGSC 9003) TaxID=240176 RepID=A8P6Z8_COPC7|nr:other/FunK1 protein kinase [Coprinopsis cinerea okayama7\|eukprot:XP_001839260.2 other/FunK1 protein kinase [Coprinopsis cinerea okayama7\